jgi:hypothetical protein
MFNDNGVFTMASIQMYRDAYRRELERVDKECDDIGDQLYRLLYRVHQLELLKQRWKDIRAVLTAHFSTEQACIVSCGEAGVWDVWKALTDETIHNLSEAQREYNSCKAAFLTAEQ